MQARRLSYLIAVVLVVALAGCGALGGGSAKKAPTGPQVPEGKWISSAKMSQVLDIDESGAYRIWGYSSNELPGYHVWGKLAAAEGQWTVVNERNNLFHACQPEQIGRYAIEASADTLKFVSVEDPCASRWMYFDKTTFQRATTLEEMVGVWQSAGADPGLLVFDRGLGHRLHTRLGTAADADLVSAGPYGLDAASGDVWVMTEPSKLKMECPNTYYGGTYKATILDDGGLSFEHHASTDDCEAQIVWLDGRGPWRRVVAFQALVGRWTDRKSGKYVLRVYPDLSYTLYQTGQGERLTLAQGQLWVTDEGVTIAGAGDAGYCPGGPEGLYTYALNKGDLTLTAAGDACSERAAFFKTYGAWRKGE